MHMHMHMPLSFAFFTYYPVSSVRNDLMISDLQHAARRSGVSR
jgi:hypothetical protein